MHWPLRAIQRLASSLRDHPMAPAFQVLDTGKPATGFRAFLPEKMQDVQPAENRFDLIPAEVVEEYPELKLAIH